MQQSHFLILLVLLLMSGCPKDEGPCPPRDRPETAKNIYFSIRIVDEQGQPYVQALGLPKDTPYDSIINFYRIENGLRMDEPRDNGGSQIYFITQNEMYPRNPNYRSERFYQYDSVVYDTFIVNYKYRCPEVIDTLVLSYKPNLIECATNKLAIVPLSVLHKKHLSDIDTVLTVLGHDNSGVILISSCK